MNTRTRRLAIYLAAVALSWTWRPIWETQLNRFLNPGFSAAAHRMGFIFAHFVVPSLALSLGMWLLWRVARTKAPWMTWILAFLAFVLLLWTAADVALLYSGRADTSLGESVYEGWFWLADTLAVLATLAVLTVASEPHFRERRGRSLLVKEGALAFILSVSTLVCLVFFSGQRWAAIVFAPVVIPINTPAVWNGGRGLPFAVMAWMSVLWTLAFWSLAVRLTTSFARSRRSLRDTPELQPVVAAGGATQRVVT